MNDPPPIAASDVRALLEAVTAAETASGDLAARRLRLVEELGRLLAADAGHWAWGRGHPLSTAIVPMAVIDWGYDDRQRAVMVEHALQSESIATFQSRVAARMNGDRRIAVTRRDVLPDGEWLASTHWQAYVSRLGLDSWVHAVSYHSADAWSCFHYLRRPGQPEFGPREATLVDLTLGSIVWLRPEQGQSPLPAGYVADLTPRQRTVMLLLLDGMPRKEIAVQLGISEYTVDDHIKAVYSHFGVRTAGELAAKFLKRA